MKIRKSFISNSSSSSFILFKQYLTKEQMDHIRNWKEFALSDEYKQILEDYSKTHKIEPHIKEWRKQYNEPQTPVEPFSFYDFPYYPLDWDVEETFDTFNISTSMDNYNMRQYLESLGVNIEKCGVVACDGHDDVFGLNDFETDMRDYLNDPDYYNNYREKYYLTSNVYRDKLYPEEVKWAKKYEENTGKPYFSSPEPPIPRKKWICEDAGRALIEIENKFKDYAESKGYYLMGILEVDEESKKKFEIFDDMFELIKEVKDNWTEIDDYEN